MTDLLHSLVALSIIIPLIVLLVYMIKRFSTLPIKKNQHLRIVAQLPLGSKHHITIVETDEVQLILGISPNQMDVLYQFQRPHSHQHRETTRHA